MSVVLIPGTRVWIAANMFNVTPGMFEKVWLGVTKPPRMLIVTVCVAGSAAAATVFGRMPSGDLLSGIKSIFGSAREFVETANWRRLERFALSGMAGLRIPALHGRSEAVTC